MNRRVRQYIELLIEQSRQRQSDVARAIGVHRQMLSNVISGRRELSMQMALKLESFFSLPEGKLLKMQAEENIHEYKQSLRDQLAKRLIAANAFWSYANVDAGSIPDEELIEKTLVYLDLSDISKLFELFPREYVKKVWKERMAVQGDYLMNLNVMIALYYFGIRQPEKYLHRVENEHIKRQLAYAQGTDR